MQPLHGYKLMALIPMFGGGHLRHYYAVVDRGEMPHHRYVVIHTKDPSAPAWDYSYGYHDDLPAALDEMYERTYVKVVFRA